MNRKELVLDPKLCTEAMYISTWSTVKRQCPNKRKYGEKCGVHCPDKKKEREAKRGPTTYELERADREKRAIELKSLRQDKRIVDWIETKTDEVYVLLEAWAEQGDANFKEFILERVPELGEA